MSMPASVSSLKLHPTSLALLQTVRETLSQHVEPVLQCGCRSAWPVLLQTVGEKLSQHVLANYEEFVSGVNEVASVERNLQVRTVTQHLMWACPGRSVEAEGAVLLAA